MEPPLDGGASPELRKDSVGILRAIARLEQLRREVGALVLDSCDESLDLLPELRADRTRLGRAVGAVELGIPRLTLRVECVRSLRNANKIRWSMGNMG